MNDEKQKRKISTVQLWDITKHFFNWNKDKKGPRVPKSQVEADVE